jgi:hypothetical protein
MVKTHLLHPEDVPYLWEQVEPLLERIAPHTEGELEADDYIHPISQGHMQLWVATENGKVHSAMVTQIVPYPQKKVLRIISIAGSEFDRLYTYKDMVESFALNCGCTALEMWGRKGWKKLLPDWKDSYVVFTKDLKERMQ